MTLVHGLCWDADNSRNSRKTLTFCFGYGQTDGRTLQYRFWSSVSATKNCHDGRSRIGQLEEAFKWYTLCFNRIVLAYWVGANHFTPTHAWREAFCPLRALVYSFFTHYSTFFQTQLNWVSILITFTSITFSVLTTASWYCSIPNLSIPPAHSNISPKERLRFHSAPTSFYSVLVRSSSVPDSDSALLWSETKLGSYAELGF